MTRRLRQFHRFNLIMHFYVWKYQVDRHKVIKLNSKLMFKGIKLVKTCDYSPEQYDVYVKNQRIGYLRAKNGWFAAWYPDLDNDGEVVHECIIEGEDGFVEHERNYHLNLALEIIWRAHSNDRSLL